MPRGKHAPKFSGQQQQAWQGRKLAPRRGRRKVALSGSLALVAAFSLLIATPLMRGAPNRGDAAAFSTPDCLLAPRLAADTLATVTPLGVNASGNDQLASATAQFGHTPVIRAYYPEIIPRPSEWTTGVLGRSHASVVLSFRPLPAQILSGADNAALAHFFDAAPQGHAIYYSYIAEPEARIRAGEFSLAAYKAAWARIVAIANAAHNPYLHATLILQGQDARPGDEFNFRDYLPAGRIISVLGWDAYPLGTVQNKNPQPTPPAQFMGPDVAASKSVGLPFGFAEFALGTPNDRPQWLTEVANYLDNNGALFGTLFNAAGFPWMVLHDSASIQTWRAAVARSASGAPASNPSSPPAPNPSSPPAPQPARSTVPPSPTQSATHAPSPIPSRLTIKGLRIDPGALSLAGAHHVTIRFRLSQAAHVSVCVFNQRGDMVRKLGRWYLHAGLRNIWYYGHDQHHRLLPAGRYQVMVIARNASGIARAQRGLAVTGRPRPAAQSSGTSKR